MKKRYTVVLNVEVNEPEKQTGYGGAYTHLNHLQGLLLGLLHHFQDGLFSARVTLDKVIDRGSASQEAEP